LVYVYIFFYLIYAISDTTKKNTALFICYWCFLASFKENYDLEL